MPAEGCSIRVARGSCRVLSSQSTSPSNEPHRLPGLAERCWCAELLTAVAMLLGLLLLLAFPLLAQRRAAVFDGAEPVGQTVVPVKVSLPCPRYLAPT